METITPLFGLGLSRNGTTWLQNVLCNHPEIEGAQHKTHWGIKESKICKNKLAWKDLGDNDKYVRFLKLYSSGDYFKLVEGDIDYFYQNRPEDFFEFFFELMDNYAKKKNARYWTTKLDPVFFRNLDLLSSFFRNGQNRYEEIKFIGIKRDYEDVLMSFLNWQEKGNKMRKLGLREVFVIYNTIYNAYGYNAIEQIISDYDGLMLKFNDLKNNRRRTVEQIVNYLEIDFSEKMLEDYYPPNSSYSGRKKKMVLPEWEKKLITDSLYPILENNNSLNRFIKKIKDELINSFATYEYPIKWRLLKLEKMEEDFKKELEEKGRIGLKKMLFEDEEE